MDLIKKNQDGSYISGWDRVRRTGRIKEHVKNYEDLESDDYDDFDTL